MRRAVMVLTLIVASTALAHSVDPSEVIAYLNAQKTREECGITRARQIVNRPDLLVIEVNDRWAHLEIARRQRLAKEWRDMWVHALKNGRVSVIDEKTQTAVVRYLPDGTAIVASREGGA